MSLISIRMTRWAPFAVCSTWPPKPALSASRYGAGLARHVTAAGVRVMEADRSDRQNRRRPAATWRPRPGREPSWLQAPGI